MKKVFIHNVLFRLLVPIFYGILVYTLILLINNNIDQLFTNFIGQEMYVCIGLSYVISEALRLLIIIFNKYWKWDFNKQVLTQFIVGVFACCLLTSIIISSYFKFVLDFSITQDQFIVFNAIFGISSMLYNLLYFSNMYMYRENASKLERQKFMIQALESELVQFKNEVNPTLLYDSLETLITLSHEDAEEAEEYIDHLSMVYRHILSHRKVELSTLDKEIKAAHNIVHLLNYQYNNLIALNINIDNDGLMASPMVPGALPTIIEGIIRSSIINKYRPLRISLSADEVEGYLIIEHVLNERLTNYDSGEASYEHIQQSYGFYSSKPVIKIKAFDGCYVKLPILELALSE